MIYGQELTIVVTHNDNLLHGQLQGLTSALDKARDSIANCVDLRLAQGPNLKQWLQTKGTISDAP